jgi:glycolate oxidase iron-sulfur subunit
MTAAVGPTCALPDTPLANAIPGIMTCVHCGFCLQACPTYLALGDENDSPRGRILLMRSLVEGTLSIDDPDVHTHIDQCLGCRGCETVCPSGVPYGHLLEATRATFLQTRPLPLVARAILRVFERPRLLALMLLGARLLRATRLPRLLGLLPGRIGFSMAMLAATEEQLERQPYTRRGTRARGRTAVLEGCVMRGLYAETNRATVRTLRANDYEVIDVDGQRCCGALHAHAGDLEGARRLARANIATFERSGADFIAVNAAGCGAMMKDYGHLLANDPAWAERAAAVSAKVRDATELLAAAGPARGAPLPVSVTYDAPCHLLHAQRLVSPPLAVLAAIPNLQIVPLTDADQCCGAAGIYNLLEPEVSGRVLEPKLVHIAATGADFVATGNPGCQMQIGAGMLRTRTGRGTVHPIDLLDASYARAE